jgi:hypothetical protein
MIIKELFLTLTFLIIINLAFSQTKISFGGELGVNSSGIPSIKNQTIANDNYFEKNKPLIRPKIGIWTKAELGKHFYSNLSVQYLTVGNKYHSHSEVSNLLNNETNIFDYWEDQSFNKISLPLSLGYNFRIKKRKLFFGTGFRLNYYTKGELSVKWQLSDNLITYPIRNETLNPFNRSQFVTPRRNVGLFLEIGMYITEKVNIEIGYTAFQGFQYSKFSMLTSYEWEGSFFFRSNDFSMSLKYSLR